MALARARRDSGIELLAGLRRRAVDAGARHHLPAVDLRGGAVLPVAGSHRQGHRAAAGSTRRSRSSPSCLSLEKTGKIEPRRTTRALAASLSGDRSRARPAARASYDRRRQRRRAARRAESATLSRQLDAEKQLTARALAQVEMLNQQIAALRRQLAALEEALDASEKKDKEIAGPHRRSRPAAQRRAGAAGAGTVALPLRLLRPAARDPRQPAGHPHRRRPLRVPVGGVLRHRPGGAASPEGRAELDKLATALLDLEKQDPGRNPLGAARRRPHRRAADRRARSSRSNWELSAARAIAVVQYLVSQGRVAAAAGRRRLRRIPADRSRRQTEEAYQAQPPHRAEADGAVSGPASSCAGHAAATRTLRSSCWRARPGSSPIQDRFCRAGRLVARALAARTGARRRSTMAACRSASVARRAHHSDVSTRSSSPARRSQGMGVAAALMAASQSRYLAGGLDLDVRLQANRRASQCLPDARASCILRRCAADWRSGEQVHAIELRPPAPDARWTRLRATNAPATPARRRRSAFELQPRQPRVEPAGGDERRRACPPRRCGPASITRMRSQPTARSRAGAR